MKQLCNCRREWRLILEELRKYRAGRIQQIEGKEGKPHKKQAFFQHSNFASYLELFQQLI